MTDKLGRIIKGERLSIKNEFKKGAIPWNKGIKNFGGGWPKGKKFSEEHRKKLSEYRKGRPGPWRGKKRPEETVRKIQESRKGFRQSEEAKKKISLNSASRGNFREKNPSWKGGQYILRGYVMVYIPEHPFSHGNGYIKRSRVTMEKSLGRYLGKEEVVHHINKIKDDDRIENLMLFSNNSEHIKHHYNK